MAVLVLLISLSVFIPYLSSTILTFKLPRFSTATVILFHVLTRQVKISRWAGRTNAR